jgi:UDP-N-acetylmuramate--alanine ligase
MNIEQFTNYFFVGIAGTGMSAIAQYLQGIGKKVSGSDRLFNQQAKMLIQEQFEKQGIRCFFQDGSGISANTEVVIVSTAIEESNVEYRKATEMGIPVMKRSELLAAISSSKNVAHHGCSIIGITERRSSRKYLGGKKRLAGH